MIDLGNISCEEKKAMEELRLRVENIVEPEMLEEPTLYYRFVKARDLDVDRAEKMFRKHITWRKAKQVKTILENFVPKEVYNKYLVSSFLGFSKTGDIAVYLAMGKIDGREAAKSMVLNNYMDHWIWYSELNIALIRELDNKGALPDKQYPQVSIIIDLDKLTFGNTTSKASMDILTRLMQLLQDNYPEGLSTLYVINAPRYYVIAFSILKAMMSHAMLRKIFVFAQDGWKEALLKAIDADVLPAFLGGNRTDPDGNPLCKTIVSHGGPIPSYYFMSDEERYFKDRSQVATIYVPKSSKKEVYVDVQEEGTVIQWAFVVKNKDIGFGLFRENLEIREILPVLRYDTVDGALRDSYKTKEAGKHILLFDNSYSWLNSKEIEYTIRIIKPTK